MLDCGCFVDAEHGLTRSDDVMRLSQRLCEVFTAAGFAAQARDDLQRWKRAKWLIILATPRRLTTGRPVRKRPPQRSKAVFAASGVDHVGVKALVERWRTVVDEAPVDNQARPGGSTWQSLQRGKALSHSVRGGHGQTRRCVRVCPHSVNRAAAGADPRPLTAAEVLGRL